MNEIRLDFLQNPPLDRELSSLLIPDFNFSSIATKELSMQSYRDKIKDKFNKDFVSPFNFLSGGFLELFVNFNTIYYVPSLHYEARNALNLISKFIVIKSISLLDLESNLMKIDNNTNEVDKNKTLVILPFINEDIFSINKIPKIKNMKFAIDISYALRLGLDVAEEIKNADIVLLNGATFGLPNGFGFIISDKIYTSYLYKKGVSEAFYKVLQVHIKTDKTNMELFSKLQESLGDDVSLFANNFAPNTLPVRFKHINTRNLIQHLYLNNIYLQSSQDCYLGFIKPSNTLISMGFGHVVARELCAITFDKMDDISYIANHLSESYKMIRLMDF